MDKKRTYLSEAKKITGELSIPEIAFVVKENKENDIQFYIWNDVVVDKACSYDELYEELCEYEAKFCKDANCDLKYFLMVKQGKNICFLYLNDGIIAINEIGIC